MPWVGVMSFLWYLARFLQLKTLLQLSNEKGKFAATIYWSKIIVISSIFTVLSFFLPDWFLAISISGACIIVYINTRKSRHKVFFRLCSLFVFFHCVVFPLIYVSILKTNENSFEFANTIAHFEKNEALVELNQDFKTTELIKTDSLLNYILNVKSSVLDSSLDFLQSRNFVLIGNIAASFVNELLPPGTDPSARIRISDNTGIILKDFSFSYSGKTRTSSILIRNILTKIKSDNKDDIDKFNITEYNINVKNDIWSYRKIVIYTLNVFFTTNMVPVSRTANIFFFIHHFVCIVFILGAISGLFQAKIISGDGHI